ncbi:MAG: hypothetical protein QNJ54_32230 [Prochloraceae cyanobacterium]|nr:hypothetical protein [Prochloraceae cyanobacterium]
MKSTVDLFAMDKAEHYKHDRDNGHDNDDDIKIIAPEAIMGNEGEFVPFGENIIVVGDDDNGGLDLDDDEKLFYKLTGIPKGVFLLDGEGNVREGGSLIKLTQAQLENSKLFIPDLAPLPPDLPVPPDLPEELTFKLGVKALIVEKDNGETEIEGWAKTNIEVTFKPVPGEEKSLSDIDPLMYDFTYNVPEITPVLDIMLTQDLSGSFFNDLPQLKGNGGQYAQLYDNLVTDRGLDAQFGIASFIDKPKSPFGRSGDFVYRTDLTVTDSKTDLINTVNSLSARGGADFPEAQLEALLQIGLRAEGEVGYRAQSGEPDDTQRFLVLSTDASFHNAGDFASAGPNNGDEVLDGTPPGTGEDYPTIDQVKSALEAADIFPIFSVTSDQIATYENLVTQLGFGDVVELAPDSNNLANAVIGALQEIRVDVDPEVVSNTTGLNVVLDPEFLPDVLSGTSEPLKVTASASDDYRSGKIVIEVNGEPFQTIDVDIPVQTLEGTEGRDLLTGSNGPDKILAGARADIINAGGGDDLVEAGLGSDQVTLGKGADIYVLDATLENARFFLGSDLITDFASEDKIELRGITQGALDVVVSGSDTLISAKPDLGFIPEPLVTLANYTDPVIFV